MLLINTPEVLLILLVIHRLIGITSEIGLSATFSNIGKILADYWQIIIDTILTI